MSLTAWALREATGGPVVTGKVTHLDGCRQGPADPAMVVMAARPDWFVIPDDPGVRALGIQTGKRRVACRIDAPCPSCGKPAKLDVCEGADRAGCFECGSCRRFYVVQVCDPSEPWPDEVAREISAQRRSPS